MFQKGHPTYLLRVGMILQTNENVNCQRQPVSKGYPARRPFMVYCTFFNFLFPPKDFKKSWQRKFEKF